MSEHSSPSRRERRRLPKKRTMAALAVVGATALTATIGGLTATAAVPSFPNNLVVFPDRDFVTIEGYQDHLGETRDARGHARRHRHRLRQVQASPRATSPSRSTTPAACAGAPAPASTSRRTSVPADKVTIKFDGDNYGDTTVGTPS